MQKILGQTRNISASIRCPVMPGMTNTLYFLQIL